MNHLVKGVLQYISDTIEGIGIIIESAVVLFLLRRIKLI